MTLTLPQLSESVQALIDARLDTIDRMLLGRVPRQDRLAIVREVETQIQELLGQRDREVLDRDDILAVLRRLDPPEAYLPEEGEAVSASARIPSRPPAAPAAQPKDSRTARASAIVGVCALGAVFLLPLVYLLTMMLQSELVLLLGLAATLALSFLGGLLGLVLGVYSRLGGVGAMVGMVTGVLALLFSVVGAIGLMMML